MRKSEWQILLDWIAELSGRILAVFMGCCLFWTAEGLIAIDESYYFITVGLQAGLSTVGLFITVTGLKDFDI